MPRHPDELVDRDTLAHLQAAVNHNDADVLIGESAELRTKLNDGTFPLSRAYFYSNVFTLVTAFRLIAADPTDTRRYHHAMNILSLVRENNNESRWSSIVNADIPMSTLQRTAQKIGNLYFNQPQNSVTPIDKEPARLFARFVDYLVRTGYNVHSGILDQTLPAGVPCTLASIAIEYNYADLMAACNSASFNYASLQGKPALKSIMYTGRRFRHDSAETISQLPHWIVGAMMTDGVPTPY